MNPPTQQAIVARKELKDLLDTRYKARLQELLRDRAPQFAAALVQVVNRSWQLQKCKPESIIGAAITAAALDLSFDPNLGEAHLVPYGDSCTFQLGYKGLTQLAQRSGQYKRLGWKVVYEGELKAWNPLTGELVLDLAAKSSDKVIGYAAYFQLLNGFERSEYWTKADVMTHAARYSQAVKKDKKDSPWFTNPDRMALKTVLMSLIRPWGPKSIQMAKAISEDNTTRKNPNAEPEAVFDMPEDDVEVSTEPERPPTPTPESSTPTNQAPSSTPDPSTSAEKPKQIPTPQQELSEIVIGWGHNFSTLIKWTIESGNLKESEASSIPSFDDLPTREVNRWLKSKTGLKAALDRINPK